MSERKHSLDPDIDGRVVGCSSSSQDRWREEGEGGGIKRAWTSTKDAQTTKKVYNNGKSVLATRAGRTHDNKKKNKEWHSGSRQQRAGKGKER